MELTVRKLTVNADALRRAFTPDIFATDEAYAQVLQGKSFRDAYRDVGLNLEKLEALDPCQTIKNRQSSGTAGNLRLDIPRRENSDLGAFFSGKRRKVTEALENLCGFQVKF
jgi:argininosuccinate lyase